MKIQRRILLTVLGFFIMMIQTFYCTAATVLSGKLDKKAIKYPARDPKCPEGFIMNFNTYKCDIDDSLNSLDSVFH